MHLYLFNIKDGTKTNLPKRQLQKRQLLRKHRFQTTQPTKRTGTELPSTQQHTTGRKPQPNTNQPIK